MGVLIMFERQRRNCEFMLPSDQTESTSFPFWLEFIVFSTLTVGLLPIFFTVKSNRVSAGEKYDSGKIQQ